ncbi:MAG: response regulator transcription factor [Chloroflexota bacterium]
MHHRLGLARTLPLLAGALAACGRQEDALAAMRQALAIEPAIMTRRFRTAGPEALLLLGTLAQDESDPFAVPASRVLEGDGYPVLSVTPVMQALSRRTRSAMRGRGPHRLVSPGSGQVVLITDRQLQIVRLLAQWKTDKEMAWELNLSPYTVSEHVQNLMRKLGVSDRREVVQVAATSGLLGGHGAR